MAEPSGSTALGMQGLRANTGIWNSNPIRGVDVCLRVLHQLRNLLPHSNLTSL